MPEETNPFSAMIASIQVNVDLSRESINELGRRGPYFKFTQFPVEVTTEIIVAPKIFELFEEEE